MEGEGQRSHSGGLFYANEDRGGNGHGRVVWCGVVWVCRALSVKWGDFVVGVHDGAGCAGRQAGRQEDQKEGKKCLRVSEH